ncbi:glycine/D-amino acid oxidase-like deaminating enzyme [Arthrobacter sp. B3I9]|uniref:NAD(P)/FAD-dependent oxidoreductase n=1 Tax=Arthrobacter sp. B3I9 TaxID=3042270 RepID=UPI002790077B|nr:FAD-dependent oxidoreductase [Arthrobacter sp. B3I9]MDQ0850519.1 glycine/D-amino acid oxidase-like deaminating enzyme [Arthrobacter sp. B3I9]
MNIVVVGAGVIGVSIAVELARRGASVTVVEKDWPGAGTSSTSYAWVNSHNKEPSSYFELNLAGLKAHCRLAASVPGCNWFESRGHVEFATDEAHRKDLLRRIGRLRERGYEVERIDVERARTLIPDLLIPEECDTVAFFPGEAHCYPNLYLAYMLEQASNLGVTLRTGLAVERLEARNGGALVGLSDGSTIAADRIVSAVGRWTSELTALAGVSLPMSEFETPGDITVGYLAVTNPLPISLPRVLTSPWLNVRPDGGGRLLLQALDLDASADPAEQPTADSVVAKELLARLQTVLKHTEGAEIERINVGRRAIPADGLSVLGAVPTAPWLYVAATHSGVTLAPFVGAGVAREIFGEEELLFQGFRPERLLGNTQFDRPSAPRKPGEQ